MESIVKQAQAAANKARATMYVFRSSGLNGHEISWFNSTGVKSSPKEELYIVVEPLAGDAEI